MGYYSTFGGSFSPSKAIPQELVKRINDADLDVRVSGEGEDYDPGEVIPASMTMHGYNFVTDLVKVQRLLSQHGIRLSGEGERSGESADDFDKTEVRAGRVYHRPGKIVYGAREEKGVECVTRYAVRVFRAARKPGEARRFLGWAGQLGLANRKSATHPPARCCGRPVMDKPPLLTLAYPKKLAFDMVEELAKLNPKREYDVVSWEDAI
jgi:hypothetical protein